MHFQSRILSLEASLVALQTNCQDLQSYTFMWFGGRHVATQKSREQRGQSKYKAKVRQRVKR